MKIFFKKIKRNTGFVLLFAVTISAILLAIALGVMSVTYKELIFSTSARATNDAFFAADNGAECALYYDKLSNSQFPINGTAPTNLICGSNTFSPTSSGIATNKTYAFTLVGMGSTGTSCAKVTLNKQVDPLNASRIIVTMTSDGYNLGGGAGGTCASADPNLVSRELLVTSYIGIPS